MQAAAQMPPPPPPPPPPQKSPLAWWQQMAQEHEAEELEQYEAPPLPQGLLGQSWVFTGGNWPPQNQVQELPQDQGLPP